MMILGAVKLMQPVHGYDVRRELLSWHADKWAKVQPGSVYHALKRLAEEGALREVGQEQVAGRPARTRYELTSKGEEQFKDLLGSYLWGQHEGEDPFIAALAFLAEVPREEASAALRSRAKSLRAFNEGARNAFLSGWANPSNKPTNVRWMLELQIARHEGEIMWCEKVADEIDAGAPYMSDELADKWSKGWSSND